MRPAQLLILALALAAAAGCPKAEEPPPEDRALRILQGEKAREGKKAPEVVRPPPAPEEDPNAKLAQIAAAPDAPERKRPLPATNPAVKAGALYVRLLELSTTQTAGTGKIKLSTEDQFLRVRLEARNPGKAAAPIAFAGATLSCGSKSFPLAPDVTRVAGSRELSRTWAPDQRDEVTLYFELPAPALETGCTLALLDARIPLQ
jgi:hypothetical protein